MGTWTVATTVTTTTTMMGTLVMFYTVFGGITAVTWTDFQQMLIMFAGVFVALIAAVMMTESSGNPDAVSPMGALVGLPDMPPLGLSMAWFGFLLATPVVWWGGWPFISASLGLGSSVSNWLGPPAIHSRMQARSCFRSSAA